MATIVKHIGGDEKYILVGAGFGAYKTSRPSVFIANHLPKEDAGEITMVAVCDVNGVVGWFPSEEIEVIEIDGVTPKDILHKHI